MNAFSVTLSLAIFFTVFTTRLNAQWDEEQEHVRAVAQSQPVKDIEVYLGSTLNGIYHYDFFRNYVGFTHFSADKSPLEDKQIYDEYNFLVEESRTALSGNTYSIFYEYDSLGNRVKSETCRFTDAASRDSVLNQKTIGNGRGKNCSVTISVFNEQGGLVENYKIYKSEAILTELREYNGYLLTKISHMQNDTIRYEEVWDYDESGRKTHHWLKKGEQKMPKTAWNYDSYGRLSSIIYYDTKYGLPNKNAGQNEARLLHNNSYGKTCTFKYDKKGRVSDLFTSFKNGGKGPDIYFKYIEPDK